MVFEWLRRRKTVTYAELMLNVRSEFALLGYPVDHLTDAEIEEVARRFGKLVAAFGVTSEQAESALKAMNLQ